jgi:predicted nucleotidyltransferase
VKKGTLPWNPGTKSRYPENQSVENMAKQADKCLKNIIKYIRELERNKIPIRKAVLFGSYARGSAKPESDIDVALISEVFSGDRFKDRQKIIPLRRNIDSRIEPLPFTPEDFDNGGMLAEEIKKNGVVIFQK